MSKNRVEELSRLGINLDLTRDGAEVLAKILANGCPVKIDSGEAVPISCPYYRTHLASFNCEKCWKNWLKDFV